MLSIMSFLTLVIYSLLMAFDVINPIVHLKYLIVVISFFFTSMSMGLFIFNSGANNLQNTLFIIVLILPVLIPLVGLLYSEAYASYWKLFIGGTIFQIGTGIYSVLGGFMKKSLTKTMRSLVVLNYFLFLVMSFNLIFDLSILSTTILYIIIGVTVSLLSLILVVVKKRVIVHH